MEVLNFKDTVKLFRKYKLPLCKTEIFISKEKAENYASKIGYPVVLKVYGPQIFHKSELGGVKTGIKNKEELFIAWDEIMKSLQGKDVEGILVQEMLNGNEVALGMKRDEQFGPVIMFGLGGIFIEVIKDVSLRISPLNQEEALKMISEIKGFKILTGYRGRKPANLNKIAEIIVNLSKMSIAEKQIQSIDFNPIIADEKKAYIADTRIII